jgi:hypothetical protein
MDATSRSAWTSVATFYDVGPAHTLAALLNDEQVPTRVTSDSKLIGDALIWEVSVPPELLERARTLLAQSNFADAEIEYLATGVLRSDGIAK